MKGVSQHPWPHWQRHASNPPNPQSSCLPSMYSAPPPPPRVASLRLPDDARARCPPRRRQSSGPSASPPPPFPDAAQRPLPTTTSASMQTPTQPGAGVLHHLAHQVLDRLRQLGNCGTEACLSLVILRCL
ncbi:hypothetical protein PVAP13_8NG210301 [Panicum virgatum]|uniref:Uncharacterized protein n=1 Tax=Panicum virgatum TaxID=38727 RepID=A0A8T0PAL0_PANVG|nr:hypothetical protein PVAP13_8NG210301 [Panicum virgatum]